MNEETTPFEPEMPSESSEESMTATKERTAAMAQSMEMLEETVEEILEAASVTRVFGEPIKQNGTVIIPAAEVMSGLGFGGGFGTSMAKKATRKRRMGKAAKEGAQAEMEQPQGGMAEGMTEEKAAEVPEGPQEGAGMGGGGRISARPVAVVVASQEGVRVEPVMDRTKITLTGIIAGGLSALMLMRLLKK